MSCHHPRKLALLVFALLCAQATADSSEQGALSTSDPKHVGSAAIEPMEGTAWVDEDGMRIAWIKYKHLDDAMLGYLLESRVNTVILKAAFHDILEMETASWKDNEVVIEPRERTLRLSLEATDRAAAHGIHVLWMASYEFYSMQPHLERLGYHHAYYEGPTRFVRAGPHDDAAALDPVFWKGITAAYGDLVAKHSVDHAIEGIMFDTEHYDGGIMYLQGSGFADVSFSPYLESRKLGVTLEDLPAGTRYDYLKKNGLLQDFYLYLEEQAYEQGRYLAERWRAVNPHLMCGTWPCFDNWFGRGMLRGMGGATRSIGLSGVEYFHGSEQTPAMADYFESRNRNLKYSPGFYPPYSYKPNQLHEHVTNAIKSVGTYWMLSPYAALEREDYREALRTAFEKGASGVSHDRPPIDLIHQITEGENGPVLQVTTRESNEQFDQPPRLSLRAAFGGSALCEDLPMRKNEQGNYQAEIDLVRRLTDNEYLSNGFRSGASYRYSPVPNEMFYTDPNHTKLCDGRGYGYFGTTVAWPNAIDNAEVVFDLHRPYRITRIQIAQPSKLEDRNGGPTQLDVDLASVADNWEEAPPLQAVFPVWSEKDNAPPPKSFLADKRHQRAWLSWETNGVDSTARWLRVRMRRVRPNSCLSLGQIVIWGQFDGEVQASLKDGNVKRVVDQGRRFNIPKHQHFVTTNN